MRWSGTGAAAYAAAAIFQPAPTLAVNLFASGEQAKELCASSPEWCVGFVTGSLDGWSALEAYYRGDKFCIPDDLTTGEVVDIFVLQLEQEASQLREPASYLLYEKLIEEFPCEGISPD